MSARDWVERLSGARTSSATRPSPSRAGSGAGGPAHPAGSERSPLRSAGSEWRPLPAPRPLARPPAPDPEGWALRLVLVSRDKMLAGALRSLVEAPGGVRVLDWYSDELDAAIRHADVVIVDMPPTLHERTFAVLDGRFLGRMVVLLQEGEHAEALPPGPPRAVLYRPVQIGELWMAITGATPPVTETPASPDDEDRGTPEGPESASPEEPEPPAAEEPGPAGPEVPERAGPEGREPAVDEPGADEAAAHEVDATVVEAEAQGLPVAESGRLIGLSGQELDPVIGPGQVAPGMDHTTLEQLRGWWSRDRQPAAGTTGQAPATRGRTAGREEARRARAAKAEARRAEREAADQAKAAEAAARRERTAREAAARAQAQAAAREEARQAKAAKAAARAAAREETREAKAAQEQAERAAREARAEEARQAKAAQAQQARIAREARAEEARRVKAAEAEAERVAREAKAEEARQVKAAKAEARAAAREESRQARAVRAQARQVARAEAKQARAARAEERRAARARSRQERATRLEARRAERAEVRRVKAAETKARRAERAEARRVAREESRQARAERAQARKLARAEARQARAERAEARRVARREARQARAVRAEARKVAREEAGRARAARRQERRQVRSAKVEARRAARAGARQARAAASEVRREQARQARAVRAEARKQARAEAAEARAARAAARKVTRAEAKEARATRAEERRAARAEAAQAKAARAEVRREEARQAKAARAEARQAARAEAREAREVRAEERRAARAEAAQQRATRLEERRAARVEARRVRAERVEARKAAWAGARRAALGRARVAVGRARAAGRRGVAWAVRPAVVVVAVAAVGLAAAGWRGGGGPDTLAGEVAVVRAAGEPAGGLVAQDPRVGPIAPLHALAVGAWLRATEDGGSLEGAIRAARLPSRFLLAGVVVLSVLVLLLLMRVGPGTGAAAGPGPAPPHIQKAGDPGRRWRLAAVAVAGALVALDPVVVGSGRAATGTVLAVALALGALAVAWGLPTRPTLRWLPLVAAVGGLALLASPLALPVLAVPVVADLLQGRHREAWRDMAALGLAVGLWLALPIWVAGQGLDAGRAWWLLGRPPGRGALSASLADAPLTWLLVAAGLAAAIPTWRHRSGARSGGGRPARLLAWTATTAAGALVAVVLGYPVGQAVAFAVPAAAVCLALAGGRLGAAAGGTRGTAGRSAQARWLAPAGVGVALAALLVAQAVAWGTRYGPSADDGLARLVATVQAEVPGCAAVNAGGPDDRARLLAAGTTVTEFPEGPAASAAGVRYFVLEGATAQGGPQTPSLAAWVREHGTRLAAHPSRTLSGLELWRVDGAPLDPVADSLPVPGGVFSNVAGSACGGYRVVDSQAGAFYTGYRAAGGKAVLGRPLGSVWTSDGPALQAFDTMVLGAVPTASGPPAVAPIELPPLLAKLDVEAVADADIPLPTVRPPVTDRQAQALLKDELIARAYLGTDPAAASAADWRRARARFGRPLGLPQVMPDGAVRQTFERAVLELPVEGGPARPAALGRLAVRLGLVPGQAMRLEPVPGLPARPAEIRLDTGPLLRLVGGALLLLAAAAGAGAVAARRSRPTHSG